jgi:hypothetical protein
MTSLQSFSVGNKSLLFFLMELVGCLPTNSLYMYVFVAVNDRTMDKNKNQLPPTMYMITLLLNYLTFSLLCIDAHLNYCFHNIIRMFLFISIYTSSERIRECNIME